MQYRSSMKADDADIRERQAGAFDQSIYRGGLGAGQRVFCLGEDRRLGSLEIPLARLRQSLLQRVADGLRIGG